GSSHAEGQQLQVAGVDAHGLGGDLVLADRHPGPPDARQLQAMADHDAEQDQRQEQVVIQRNRYDLESYDLDRPAQIQAPEMERVDLVHAFGAVGDVDRIVQVVQEHPDDFAETERDDCEVIAP